MASKETGSKFLYFAFGSNMCTKRIHINNPSAVFKHVAVVEGYKLFFGYSASNVSLASLKKNLEKPFFAVGRILRYKKSLFNVFRFTQK